MKKEIPDLFRFIILAAVGFFMIGMTKVRAQQDKYSQMTVLDIDKGAIVIDTDKIKGYDKDGTPVTAVNSEGYHIISSAGQTSNKITVEPGVTTKIVADNLNIVINMEEDTQNPSPLFIRPGASVTLILEGKNRFSGSKYNAAIGVPQADDGTMAELTIEGDGSAYCITGKRGAGIGGGQRCGYTEGAGIITINSGSIQAYGGDYGGGIGNSERDADKNCRITINGGIIYAQAGSTSSGIGGGRGLETKGADITINGGLVYSTGSNYGIRGSSIEINGGNVISCKNNDTDNWQSFATSVKNFKGDIVRFASVQLDNIDADRKLTVTCGGRTYEVQSDKQARVNVILFQEDGDDIKIKSESGNEYTIDYSTLDTPETVTDRPFRYPVLTITPDSGQKAQYGDPFVPSYKVYDAGNTQVENTDSILSGAPEYKKKYDFWDTPPFEVIITYGNLKVIDGEHCITFTQNVEADILKRKIQVSAKDLEVYEGQYSRCNLPFVLKLEEGSLLPGDTLENAFDLIVGQINGENYFSAGTYTDLDITFESDYYEVSMKGQKPALKVLENECLLRPDEILTFGTDSDGNTLQWVVAHVTDQKSFLYSKNVYDNDTYSSAVIKRNQSGDYINEKFPSLSNYKFLKEIDILDLTWLEAISQDGGKAAAKAEDIYGNPKKYWLVNYRYHNPLYIDENGKMKETSDETDTAGLRIILAADIRSHTVPVISLSDKITSSAEYGDIKAGTQIAQVKDSANISGHELTSLKLLNKTRDADSFTLKDNGTIVADKMLTPGSYTLYA